MIIKKETHIESVVLFHSLDSSFYNFPLNFYALLVLDQNIIFSTCAKICVEINLIKKLSYNIHST